MIHLVYCDNKEKVIEKIMDGTKTMVIRAAAGRKIPHSRVFEGKQLYFEDDDLDAFLDKLDKFNDINQLIEMRIGYLKEDYGTLSEEQINRISKQLPEYFKNHLNKYLYVYAGECNGDIVSTLFMLVVEKPANPSFLTGKIGTFLNVYTKKNARRKGIADALVKMALKDAEKLNLSYVELHAQRMDILYI